MNHLVKVISLAILLLSSTNVSASLIAVMDESTQYTHQINQSFEEFYNYGGKYDKSGADKYSSNTGFEVSDYLTLFFVENLNKEVALFGLIDKAKDKTSGNLLLKIHVNQGDASKLSFLLIDDSGDIKRKNTDLDASDNSWDIEWKWAKNYSDGFILTGFEQDDYLLSFSSDKYKGLAGIKTYAFSNSALPDLITAPANVTVSEPHALLLFSLSIIALLGLRGRTQ